MTSTSDASEFLVTLMRHGEVSGGNVFRGWIDQDLTDEGWRQMYEASTKAGAIQSVFSSPLIRCQKFAQKFSTDNGLPLEILDEFREISFGEWEGLSAQQILDSEPEAIKAFWTKPEVNAPPGGESLQLFSQRITKGWERFLALNSNQDTLIVAHGGTIRALVCCALQLPLTSINKLEIEKGSLTRLRIYQTDGSYSASLVFLSMLSDF